MPIDANYGVGWHWNKSDHYANQGYSGGQVALSVEAWKCYTNQFRKTVVWHWLLVAIFSMLLDATRSFGVN